jgi:hypothetical protein
VAASVIAIHEPSGTSYEAVTQADGRFAILGMRVGGPYKATAELTGFGTQTKDALSVTLGTSTDVEFTLSVAAITEQVTVKGTSDATFGSQRTGAATAVTRAELALLPTVSGRINDITRLTPQYSGNGGFGGVDNRMNNITVDGSYFNNSFGLQGQPGDRTGVAPISLEAVEQIQVSVAPYDVRQGNFVGAGVNTVTRSGTNKITGSFYYRYRDDGYVGTEAAGLPFNPGTFTTKNTGFWVGGPFIKNKLFAIGNFDFTLITVHLTFANGNTAESAREMTNVLHYLDWYFGQPEHDPDVLICGDFNIPSLLSGMTGSSGITLDQVIAADSRFTSGERRLVLTVHEPTSRNSAANGGMPVNNYDHCIVSANAVKGLIQARRVSTSILTDDPQDPEARLTSDHFPIVALFRTRGSDIFLDFKTSIRPPGLASR